MAEPFFAWIDSAAVSGMIGRMKMQRKKYTIIVKILIFIILFAGAFSIVQGIICEKFLTDSTRIVNGFYAEKENDIDVICIGSSNCFCTIDPVVLYEQYGIAAYDFGSSSQPMNLSYLYLQEALDKQKPKLVALEVNMMIGDSIANGGESGLRWGYTDIPLSFRKLSSLYDTLGKVDETYFSYVFPITRYHNRWKDVYKTDFVYRTMDKTDYDKGYYMTTEVSEQAVVLDDYQCEGEAWIADSNVEYLDKMVTLCKKKGVPLLLFKSPRASWYSYETAAIAELATERGLDFLDYNELIYENPEAVGLDLERDFRDAQHLNNSGVAKVTTHFGSYIMEKYQLPDRRIDTEENSWDRALRYRNRCGQQPFMYAATAQECWDLVDKESDYCLILTKNSVKPKQQWVYIDGKLHMSKSWEEDGIEHMKIGKSELVLSRQGAMYQVLIDDTDYYQGNSNWSIVVYDTFTNRVAASLAFEE